MEYFFSLHRARLLVGLLFLLLLKGLTAQGQAPAWQTAMAVTSAEILATATGANGSIFISGYFDGTVSFGSTTLTSAGASDAFIAKWNTTSNSFAWAQRAGGLGYDAAYAVAVAGTNVYIAGSYASSQANFGSISLNNNSNRPNSDNAFVAKLYDGGSASSFVWAQQAGGAENDAAVAVAVSGTNVYVTGKFSSSTALFGAVTLTSPSRFAANAFVAKLTDAGNTSSFIWAQQSIGADQDRVQALAVNGASVYITGAFLSATVGFGTTTLLNTDPMRGTDGFIAKLTDAGSTGSFIWAQQVRGTSYESISTLAVSGTSLYVGANYGRAANVLFGTLVMATGGNTGMFVAKLVDLGSTVSFIWTQQTAGGGILGGNVLVYRSPNLYVTGSFIAPIINFGGTALTNTGNADVFVAKLADLGSSSSFVWAQHAGGTGFDTPSSLAIIGSGVFVGGSFNSGVMVFGTQLLANPLPVGYSGFLASLTDPTLTAAAAAQSSLSVALAPNPANATTSVTLPAMPGAATATLTLRDALGRTLRTETLPLPPAGLRHELGLTGLAPGIYALQVRAGTATATRRLVVD